VNFSEEEPEEADARWTVRLTQRARADLDAQVAFLTQNVGDAQADAWEDGALETAGRWARFPTRHPLVPEAALFREAVHQVLYRPRRSRVSWRLLFALRGGDDGPIAYVLHVRHGARGPLAPAEAREIENAD